MQIGGCDLGILALPGPSDTNRVDTANYAESFSVSLYTKRDGDSEDRAWQARRASLSPCYPITARLSVNAGAFFLHSKKKKKEAGILPAGFARAGNMAAR